MKVAFAIGEFDYRSGIVKVVWNIARELANSGRYDISVITTGLSPDTELNDENIRILNLDIEKYGHRKRYLHMKEAIQETLRSSRQDTIIVSGMEYVMFYSIAAKHLKIRMIAWEHRNFLAGEKFRLEWIGKRYALKHWDGVLCITKRDYELYSNYQKAQARIYQIYNLATNDIVRHPYNVESTIIISCGSLEKIKGIDALCRVAEIVLGRHPGWTWEIYGDGSEKEHLSGFIAEKKLKDKLIIKGYSKEMNSVYGNCAIFVFTSKSEGMGMVLVEAQRAGLPIVSFDINCGPSDVIEDNENGFLIEPFEVETMANKIDLLISNARIRQEFSNNSECKIAEFNRDFVLNRWINLLDERQ